ncbi:cytochrome P450 [Amycolatopsis speibonae]|uniref:Cytochrome P450 n=1 Tax=Amycolatopsis speibonae TaxID=1450224 RepID=A0ABV7PAK2_9PSEU
MGSADTRRRFIEAVRRLANRRLRLLGRTAQNSTMTMVRVANDVPSAPGGLPVLGHALAFKRDPVAFLGTLRALGPMVRIQLGPKPAYVVNDEHLIRRVFVPDAHKFDKGIFWEKVGAIVGNGLANSSGTVHLRQRRMMQPMFHRRRIALYATTMAAHWAERVAGWQEGQVLDVPHEMADTALSMVVRTVFSSRLGDGAVEAMRSGFPDVQDGVMWRTMNPFPVLEKLPTPGNRRFAAGIDHIQRAVDTAIAAYRADGSDHGDLLSTLVAARDPETGTALTDDEIRDQVLTIALAAGDTTANALAWALYQIGTSPELGQCIAAEVAEVAKDRPLDVGDLDALVYTDRVVQEVFRFYAFWMLMRRTLTDVVLGDVRLPAGAQVLISPLSLHRDPAIYPDAGRFLPDRWTSEVRRTAFIPFGAGARQCIGDRFAWTEVMLGLATICRRWQLVPVTGQTTREVCRISLNPAPLHMTVTPR